MYTHTHTVFMLVSHFYRISYRGNDQQGRQFQKVSNFH